MSRGTCSYICMYINAVANSVMLQLRHDFYNIIFKIKHKLYIASGSAPAPSSEKFWMRAYCLHHEGTWRRKGITPLILKLGTRFMARPLSARGKRPRYPLNRKQGWPQGQSGRFGEGKVSCLCLKSMPCHVQSIA